MEITLQFQYPINQSCQEGDITYYTPTSSSGGFDVNTESGSIVEIGKIISIVHEDTNDDDVFDITKITCEIENSTAVPTTSDFIFFGKERSINEASITGYYGEFKFINNSKQKAELFSAACEITESSK